MPRKQEIWDALLLFRKTRLYVLSLTDDQTTTDGIVMDCLRRHSKQSVLSDHEAMDAFLADVTSEARSVQPDDNKPVHFDPVARDIQALPFDTRACLLLRASFGMDYTRIGAALGIPADVVMGLHAAAMESLAEGFSRKTNPFHC